MSARPIAVVAAPPAIKQGRLGTVLLVVGLVGVVLAVLVALGLFRGAMAARDLDDRVAAGQQRIAATLTQLGGRLDLVATSLDNAGATLGTTSQTVGHASDVLADVATVSGQLAEALNVSILGRQPFAGASTTLTQLSGRIATFEEDAAKLNANLATNAGNASSAAESVRAIRDEVIALAADVQSYHGTGEVAGLIVAGTALLGLLVAWIGVVAALCAWVGWRLRRARR